METIKTNNIYQGKIEGKNNIDIEKFFKSNDKNGSNDIQIINKNKNNNDDNNIIY